MTTSKLLLRYVAFMSIGALFACSPGGNMPIAQTGARDSGIDHPVTSAPAEDTHGRGEIDYKNAQPMPMPSLPDPPPSDDLPIPPSDGGSMGQPGSSPGGGPGTGEQTPRVLFPPKSLPGTSPADDPNSADKKSQ